MCTVTEIPQYRGVSRNDISTLIQSEQFLHDSEGAIERRSLFTVTVCVRQKEMESGDACEGGR